MNAGSLGGGRSPQGSLIFLELLGELSILGRAGWFMVSCAGAQCGCQEDRRLLCTRVGAEHTHTQTCGGERSLDTACVQSWTGICERPSSHLSYNLEAETEAGEKMRPVEGTRLACVNQGEISNPDSELFLLHGADPAGVQLLRKSLSWSQGSCLETRLILPASPCLKGMFSTQSIKEYKIGSQQTLFWVLSLWDLGQVTLPIWASVCTLYQEGNDNNHNNHNN